MQQHPIKSNLMKSIYLLTIILAFSIAACNKTAKKPTPQPQPVVEETIQEVEEEPEVYAEEVFEEPVFKTPSGNDKYFLISASFMEYSNAEKLQQDLAQKGMRSEIIQREHGPNPDFYKVSYMSFNNWEQAVNALESERNTPGKESVWLLVKR